MTTVSPPPPDADLLRLGAFELDRVAGRLTGPEGPVHLPRRAWEMLLVLVREPGRLVGRDELFELVWEGLVVEEGNLHQTVSVLRRAFASQDPETVYVETERGRGYRFVAPVLDASGPAADAPATPGPAPDETVPRAVRTHRWRVPALALLLVIAAVAAGLLVRMVQTAPAVSPGVPPNETAAGSPPAHPQTVDNENRWLARSAREHLAPAQAARFEAALDALAREDPRKAGESLEPLLAAAPSFGPGWIALAEARRQVGDERGSRDAAGRALALAATEPPPTARRIEAEAAWIRRDFERATELFGKLAEEVPDDPEPALRLADSLKNAGRYAEARATLGRLREAGGNLPDARTELADASVLRRQEDFEGALAACRRAERIALSQDARLLVARARQYMGFNLLSLGRAEEALTAAEEARKVAEPLGASAQVANLLYLEGLALDALGRPAEAEERLRANLALREKLGYRTFLYLGHHALAELARERGDLATERRELEIGMELCKGLDVPCRRRFDPYLGRNLVETGELAEGERLLTGALDECRRSMDTEDCTTALRALASLELRRGEPERAAGRLDEAVELARRVGQAALAWDLRLERVAVERARGNPREAERLLGQLEAELPAVDSLRRRQALAAARRTLAAYRSTNRAAAARARASKSAPAGPSAGTAAATTGATAQSRR